ncbi:ABC-type nitrate/sulfonate/bicarbonate transport system permease component [Nocardia sp. GAS34]|uniref:ABC transporter permease n=1 Tax=unclassified Nocardia TaxID=2637762 RepID=UPI003D225C73
MDRLDSSPLAATTGRLPRLPWPVRRALLRGLSLLVVLGVWEWYGRHTNPILFTYPTAIVRAGWAMAFGPAQLGKPNLWGALGQSLNVFAWGLGLAIVAGVVLGLAMGRSRVVEALLELPMDALYATPTVALVPVIVLWVGFGTTAKIVVVFLFSVFAIVLNTARGVREVDPQLLEVARSYLATEPGLWRDVLLPAALPYVITGIRLAVGRALVGVVIAEFYSAISGLGFVIMSYANTFQIAQVFVPVVILMLLGVTFTWVLRLLEAWLAPWRSESEG